MRSGCKCGEEKLNFPIELVMSLGSTGYEEKIKTATRKFIFQKYFLTDELAANAVKFAKVIKTI